MSTKRIAALAFAGLLGVSGPSHAQDATQSEDIVIGLPAWPSAQVTANVIATVLEERLQVGAELRPRGTLTLLRELASGKADVHPEVWLPIFDGAIDRFDGPDGNVVISDQGVTAGQNMCVTRHTADSVGIAAVSDLTRPDIASRFDTDGDGKGEVWIGAATWSATSIEQIRARSYGYDRTMTLLEMPEDAAMAAVDVAVSLDRPIVFYCYWPHHVFSLHDIVVLDEPAHDPDTWMIVTEAEDADWLEKSRADTAWGTSHFHVGYGRDLAARSPAAAAFLSNIAFTADDITAMSYAIAVEDKPAAQVATEWIAANEERIEGWLQ